MRMFHKRYDRAMHGKDTGVTLGATAIEYGMIAILIAVVVIGALKIFGSKLVSSAPAPKPQSALISPRMV